MVKSCERRDQAACCYSPSVNVAPAIKSWTSSCRLGFGQLVCADSASLKTIGDGHRMLSQREWEGHLKESPRNGRHLMDGADKVRSEGGQEMLTVDDHELIRRRHLIDGQSQRTGDLAARTATPMQRPDGVDLGHAQLGCHRKPPAQKRENLKGEPLLCGGWLSGAHQWPVLGAQCHSDRTLSTT